jgi:hypothetical protein
MGLPQIDEIGKRWDREQNTVFCSVGNKAKLQVIVPLSPADFKILQENIDKQKPRELEVELRVQGHGMQLWQGRVGTLPMSEAKFIPIQLSTKMGGPIAVKPGSSPQELVPQSQVYLVPIGILEPDDTLAINSHAQVKIHCEYHSCAWWIYRTIASTFDLPLMGL